MSYHLPQWEERTSYGYRRIDPYTKLFEERIIFLGTPISDDVANAVMAQLLALQSMDPERDISLYINSPGGSFTAMTDRKSTRLNSSHVAISYAVFCLKKNKTDLCKRPATHS